MQTTDYIKIPYNVNHTITVMSDTSNDYNGKSILRCECLRRKHRTDEVKKFFKTYSKYPDGNSKIQHGYKETFNVIF